MAAAPPTKPILLDHSRLAEMTEETMARFNGMIADHPESLAAIRKEHDLVWTHGPFGEYNTIKVFPVKRHKKTGKLVDLPSSDMSGPGKMRIRFAYGQVGLLTQTPENMTNLEQPLESVLFMRPEDEGYDPVISAAFTEEMEYINNFLNEQRVKYLAEHEHELNYFPTLTGKSPKEIEEALLHALDAGRSDPLAYRKYPDKPSSKILEPDWTKRHADDPERRVNRLCRLKIEAFRQFYVDHPDAPRRIENNEGIDKLEEELDASQKGKDKKFMKLHLIRHADSKGTTMDRVAMLSSEIRGRGAVVSAMCEIGAIRVSVFESKKAKGGKKVKKQAADDFKNVSVDFNLLEVHWAFNGRPFGASKPTIHTDVTSIMGPAPGADGGSLYVKSSKRKASESDDEALDAAVAGVDVSNLMDGRPSKRSRENSLERADPTD